MTAQKKGLALTVSKGFTLIELLVVIGILAVLLAIVLIAINPARQFAQANNTKRSSDVSAILNAIGQYSADNRGNLTALSLTTGPATGASELSSAGTNICTFLIPRYLAELPVDPLTNTGTAIGTCSGEYSTNYRIVQSTTDNRITVQAPAAELGATISITR